jgi:hypothetical protein
MAIMAITVQDERAESTKTQPLNPPDSFYRKPFSLAILTPRKRWRWGLNGKGKDISSAASARGESDLRD